MIGAYIPTCTLCDWQGTPSGSALAALKRADAHTTQAHEHHARPQPGSELYPEGWDKADVPDWILGTCALCAEAIEWDPRNLWSHSD
jgi:hypothetical protein